jgi:FAD binding domain
VTGDLATGEGIEAAVAGTEDVSQVVLLARETGLELAVRSGGHSLAGHGPTDGGIVLDLADMDVLEIDPEQRTARAQTGLTGSPVPHIPPLPYGGVVAAVALLGWLATVVPTRVALGAAPAEVIGMRE